MAKFGTNPFRKAEAAELVSGGSPVGVSGAPVITGPAAPSAMVRGAASATGTGATEIIAAQGSGIKIYITSIQLGRSDAGTTAIIVTLNDTASTILVLPNDGHGHERPITFPVPLVVAANTHLTFTSGSSITTVYCAAQGYTGA